MRNWRLIENPNLDKGKVYDFYEISEVNEVLNKKDREISRLNKLIKKMSVRLNENIAKNVDGNVKYWQDLCEKRTKMYLEEQASHIAVADELQKQIHKPFPYIEKLKMMKIALFRQMSQTAYSDYTYLELFIQYRCLNEETKRLYEPRLERKRRQWILFKEKAKELEKELEND